MSRLKRRVTVDQQQSTQEESDRRSVFDRLGSAGGSRKYDDNICRKFLAGQCYFGANCRYKHVKRQPERDDSSSDEYRKPVRTKSTVRRNSDGSDREENMRGNKKLDFKKELELEQKRQQIQRELKQLGGLEERENITIERKVSSSDESSPERSQSQRKKKSPNKKKEKKKHKVKSPSKIKVMTPSPEKKIKKLEDQDKDTGPKKKHKKKKSLDRKITELEEEEVKPKKSKHKGSKVKSAEQKPRLSFQSEEDEEDTIVVKKNRQRTPSESPSRSFSRSRSRSWSQDLPRQQSDESRSPSPVQRRSRKAHRGYEEDIEQSVSPEPRHPDRRARSSSYESQEEHSSKRKGKKDSKKGKHKQEPQYQSESEESDYSRERSSKVDKKKHKKGRGDWSPDSHTREAESRSREQRKTSSTEYREHKSQKDHDKHSPVNRDRRRSATPVSRHSHMDSRREMSPVSPRSGSAYHRDRRMTPPPDRRELEDRYDKRDRGKDDPRHGGRFPSQDRRYGKIHPGDRPELDRGPDSVYNNYRHGDRRDIHDDRFVAPPRGEPPPRGRYDDSRRYYDQRGRPESFDRDRDRYERDRYGQRMEPRGPPPRDHRDRGDPHIDPRPDPRYPEASVFVDRGPPPPDFRDPGWERWQGPEEPYPRGKGYNPDDRFRGNQRGNRFDIPPPLPPERQSRRGDWERRGEFFVPERRDWVDRRDEHRDFPREDERRNDRQDGKGINRYDRSDRRNDDRDRSRDPRERYNDINRGDPREGSMDRHDRRDAESYKSREFSSDRMRDVEKDAQKKDRKVSEPREADRPERKENVEKERKEIVEKVSEVKEKEKEKIEKIKETEDKEGKKKKEEGDPKKPGDKEKKKRTKAEKKARKEEKLKAKQKKLEEKLAKEKLKGESEKEPVAREEDIIKDSKGTPDAERKTESRKRILSGEKSKSLSPSPTSKRVKDGSPATSVNSRHSLGARDRSRTKEEPEVRNERSRPKSAECEKDDVSVRSHGSDRRFDKKQKEISPAAPVSLAEDIKEQKKKKRSRSPSGEEEYKRRRTGEERDRVRKLRGSVDEEGGRFSDFTDDSTDDILNQAEPQQAGSAIPEHVYREGGRRRRSRSRSSYSSRQSHHDTKGHRSESSRYRDRRSRSRSKHRSGERDRRSRGDPERDKDREDRRDRGRDRNRDRDRNEARPRSGSEGGKEEIVVKSEVKAEDVKSETKDDSAGESEDDLSLDSISSDEEFEADQEKKHSIDALEIDWASLQQDVRPKPPVTGSALNRYKASNIFAQIGVCKEYAGEELFNKIQNICKENETDENEQVVKTEDVKPENKFKFESDIAVFHSSITSKKRDRQNLLRNIGPFRRALCARRDLEIRRQLCKVDKSMDTVHSYPSHVVDQELYKLSVQLFRQSCPDKPNVEQIKQEVTCS